MLPELTGISHVVYAALFEKPALVEGWRDAEQIETNTRMLRNLLDHLEPMVHFTLLQGTKAYGAHLGPMKLPGKEGDPRHRGANFYWEQEDLLRARAAAAAWTFSILRPQIVCGQAIGSPMNVVNALGVFAALRREQGLPLAFPGGGGFVTEATDARLLARAILWAGTEPRCADETLNVTNGDVIEWRALWPEIADHFDMPVGEDEPQQLARTMPPLAGAWDELVRAHGLAPYPMDTLVGLSWQFADAVLGIGGGQSTLLSTIKVRELGFGECIDSARMFREHLAKLQAARVLPA